MTVVDLIAERIEFTKFFIVYHVRPSITLINGYMGHVVAPNDIFEKDLILNPTLISHNNMKVVYASSNVTPVFYQGIFEETLRNFEEYETEKKEIYHVGDVVGKLILDKPIKRKTVKVDKDQMALALN
ncbi:MAG: hypothetical protein CMI02_00940 [Oceanospirillaceae bacterium]|nr:hypothetical protein [Oceanospirillaceae bacterium]|tara:strand:- start:268 stop:651 length:384 start_codon:yes stop_codon:yes gene_type:complete